MTSELKNLLDQFSNLINKWNAEEIPNQEELLTETRNLVAKLRAELKNPQPEQAKIEG